MRQGQSRRSFCEEEEELLSLRGQAVLLARLGWGPGCFLLMLPTF